MITFTDRTGQFIIATIEYADPADRAMLLEACQISQRDDLRAQLDRLARRERALMAAATPAQHRIGWGDCFAADYPGKPIPGVWWAVAEPVTVYGKILTLAEYKAREHAHGLTASEWRRQLRHTVAAYERGWRYADVCSVAEPEAPPDDTHVAMMRPITLAEYQAAVSAIKGSQAGRP